MSYKSLIYLLLFLVVGAMILPGNKSSALDLSNPQIPVDKIMSGGPPKDGIPAILEPKFITAKEADNFLKADDRVLGVVLGGLSKAYPVNILNWHEIVNDRFKERQVVVTYCPLCGTGMAFDSMVAGKSYSFGVSGLLFNSDVLFYDHQTESLWSQILMKAVTGKMSGSSLTMLPVLHTSWKNWKSKHPQTMVLSRDTGYRRDYDRSPYERYEKENWIMFPVEYKDDRYPSKEWVIGIKIKEVAKAYPYSELRKAGKKTVEDSVGGQKITIHFDSESSSAYIEDTKGEQLNTVVGFWFAWYAFYPNTEVFTAK